jgi:SpoVK/Ycf46/Vps4 family AAA+-type ATPase
METATHILPPTDCAARIFDFSGRWLEPDKATEVWEKVLQHKWYLSEKLDRDVGIKVACLDYVENVAGFDVERHNEEDLRILNELGAKMVDGSVWDTISPSQPPKQIVEKRVILPLTEVDLARKHGVTTPRAIIFFGPPGTGKTHFVRAIAGVLQWWYVEISPSTLTADGEDRLGANLKRLMEKVRDLDEAVIFIDEFEEIAGSRDQASRLDKSITNEFLKQVPVLKRQDRKNLLICATNYIGQLDSALLRPGRFDCVIPVGGLDDMGRRTIVEHYLAATNRGDVDLDRIVAAIPMFTPADVEYLFQKVKQTAFEQELVKGEDFRVTTETILDLIPRLRPTLTEEIVEEFEQDAREYTRY